jgi:hypothetical protein
MSWTKPRLIAYKNEWYPDVFDHVGPTCYEIGTGGPRGGNIQWHYVGETKNEKTRLSTYARSGSHLAKTIKYHLNQGWHIYYRAWARPSKEAAKEMQDNLLKKNKYDWNWVGNR